MKWNHNTIDVTVGQRGYIKNKNAITSQIDKDAETTVNEKTSSFVSLCREECDCQILLFNNFVSLDRALKHTFLLKSRDANVLEIVEDERKRRHAPKKTRCGNRNR